MRGVASCEFGHVCTDRQYRFVKLFDDVEKGVCIVFKVLYVTLEFESWHSVRHSWTKDVILPSKVWVLVLPLR